VAVEAARNFFPSDFVNISNVLSSFLLAFKIDCARSRQFALDEFSQVLSVHVRLQSCARVKKFAAANAPPFLIMGFDKVFLLFFVRAEKLLAGIAIESFFVLVRTLDVIHLIDFVDKHRIAINALDSFSFHLFLRV